VGEAGPSIIYVESSSGSELDAAFRERVAQCSQDDEDSRLASEVLVALASIRIYT
jgi:hypothetical protein